MSYQLGIDLGTTYTAAAVCRSSDRRWVEPEVVTLGSRSATVPSVIFVAPDGAVVVGEAAERRAVTDFDRVVREFKRRIGDPTPVMVAGRAWAPQELSARLVRWVVDRVAEREGGPADRIAVTHPAAWGSHKKDLLGSALAGQGLTVTFLAEPQAAALSYSANERVGGGSTIAVYDLGGGTFDAAVVRKGDPSAPGGAAGFGLLGRAHGLERLGGIDFDEAVFEHVIEGMPDAFAELDDSDPAVLSAVARLRRDCTEAKEALSSDTEVSIPVMLPSARGSVRLHRSEFEAMIRPQLEETVSALRSAVGSAGAAPDQLTAVLLVGGSSRIPLVGQLVSEQLGRPVAVDADPKNAIAKGAALAISPQPTASWPGVSIPPVPAAAAAQGLPQAPPPRPGMGAPPPGGRHGGGPGAPYAPAGVPGAPYAAGGTPPRGSGPASHAAGPMYDDAEPPTTELAQVGPPPPARPPADPEPDDWDYGPEPEPRRRPNGMLIGLGALLAVAAVVAAVVWWPTGSTGAGVDAGSDGSLTTSDSAPAEDESSGSGSGGSAGSGGEDPAPPAPGTSAPEETTAPAPTSEDEPPADEEPTTKPSTKPSSTAGSGDDSGSDADTGGDSGGGADNDSDASGDNASGADGAGGGTVGEVPVAPTEVSAPV
ncbi:Hsp70 family protein [Pseudonocardia sp. MH-G8]|uniref:Hsp70 family protein n=1 Tax=Pseudonocardia sp. MH-G8 TaxID=1854588 RepID=UPI000BA10FA8|nr:Hsp70 family protein [Pseudonocardia sp. MH-G8]OZM82882.1 heat-shock protein Hsp70 [Pseudonocardia sp. MH-G8]